MSVSLLRKIVTLGALGLALGHLLWPSLAIDAITLALVALAIVPWLAPLFKALELPGGWKIQFQDLQNVQAKADDAGLLSPKKAPESSTYVFQDVAERDPNLALAGLRIELEKRLVQLAERQDIGTRMQGLGRLLHELSKHGVLSEEESSVISDMLSLLNDAVHGASVDPRASEWAIDVGPLLLQTLDEKLGAGGGMQTEPRG